MTDGINAAKAQGDNLVLGRPLQFGDEAQIREIKRREAFEELKRVRREYLAAVVKYEREFGGDAVWALMIGEDDGDRS